jgi:hypothetical protein
MGFNSGFKGLTSVWELLVLQNYVFCTPTWLTKLTLMFVWMSIIMTFLKSFFPHTQGKALHNTENFIYWGNNKELRIVLFTVVSQDNGINSKQTKFNWPANYKTYQYYMPLFKKRFLKKNIPYFPCINIPHCVIQWQSTDVPSHTICIHSDQTKYRHF